MHLLRGALNVAAAFCFYLGLTMLPLAENTAYFREKMTAAGFDVKPGVHPISPVMLFWRLQRRMSARSPLGHKRARS